MWLGGVFLFVVLCSREGKCSEEVGTWEWRKEGVSFSMDFFFQKVHDAEDPALKSRRKNSGQIKKL